MVPDDVLGHHSLLSNLVLDYNTLRTRYNVREGDSECDDVYAYISSISEPALLVYDSRNDSFWRFSHPYMYPDPNFGLVNVSTT